MMRSSAYRFTACAIAVLQTSCLSAEEATDDAADVLAGHSYHGEAYNEGPRQRARLIGGTGRVHFPVTTDNDECRQFIEQGIGQLHGFWYFEAERSFRQAAAIDPDCAIAYWGMAMANRKNAKRSKGFIAEAVERKDSATKREQLYIDALNEYLQADPKKKKERAQKYVKALEKIIYEFPDDIEAKAMLGLTVWTNRGNDIAISSHIAADALLNDVLDVEPMHPCHHYRIHLWDHEKPEQALNSSALCGQAAPAIAHMWHMPGHIYSRLKRYGDAVWQQEASARVDHAQMMRDGLLPDQISNFAHNNEWLIRNLIYVGRVSDALSLARNMIELPRHPKYNVLSKSGSLRYGRLRLFDVLSRFELWDELLRLSDTPYLEPTDDEKEQIKRLRYIGRACFRSGGVDRGREVLAELEQRLAAKKQERDRAAGEAEEKAKKDGKEDKELKKAVDAAKRPFNATVTSLEKATQELEGHSAIADEDYDHALELFKKSRGVGEEYLAEVNLLAGKREEAEKIARKNVESNKNEVRPLAGLVEILWKLEKRDAAKETFETLREVSTWIEISSPVFARLEPIALELEYPADWRVSKPPAEDVGQRPTLDSLGPFRWQPSSAPRWKLPAADGSLRSWKDFEGRPVVMIFYLGFGCLHCAEQLQAFAPKTEEFEKAGLSLIAVSTDDLDQLRKSQENYDEGAFPFPLVADPEFEAFKAYRVFDDFEGQPLHGTFLVDSKGLIRWHDISYSPFNDPEFVLKEASRLLHRELNTETADKTLAAQPEQDATAVAGRQ